METRNVIRGPCNVIKRPYIVIMGPCNVITRPCNVNMGPGNVKRGTRRVK